jgi:hypothetical protein
VFRERFNYQTEVVELNMKSKPQHQLNRRMMAFIDDHDGPRSLMIVYYTGHGVYREDSKQLELFASMNPILARHFVQEPRANWGRVEEMLHSDEVEGDVLTILDTCYASNLIKGTKESTKKFELMSACAIDMTTAAPGNQSFTRALIDALGELVDMYGGRPFSTFHMTQRINLDKRRADTPAMLWSRGQGGQHILLAPLKAEKERADANMLRLGPPRGFLTLRFGLRDETLNREQVEYLARQLSKAFNNRALLGIRGIDWLGIRVSPVSHFSRVALVMYAITQWKKFVRRRHDDRRAQSRKRPFEQLSMEE